MKSVTVGQFTQNPTAMLADVESGNTYRITRHNREIGRIVPPSDELNVFPPKNAGPAHTVQLPRMELCSASSIDELVDEAKDEW